MRHDYKGLGTEPYMPYIKPEAFQPYTPQSTPAFPGPGWYRGPAIYADLPPNYNSREAAAMQSTDLRNGTILPTYAGITAQSYSPAVRPVGDPVGGMSRPAPPDALEPVAYVPSNLPGPIYPGTEAGRRWYRGPSVYTNVPTGTTYEGFEDFNGKWTGIGTAVGIALGIGIGYFMFKK
jgi:hypothetical protein